MRNVPLEYSDPIRERLEPGEVTHWTGRPRQGVFFQLSDIVAIPFSLVWGGFAIVWESLALRTAFSKGAPLALAIIFPLFGLPFVVAGLNMIAGRFYFDARRRRRTWYAVTDRRVLIVTGAFSPKTLSLLLAETQQVILAEHRDGTGTIAFSRLYSLPHRTSRGEIRPAFDHIAGAADVFRLIEQLRAPHVAAAAAAAAVAAVGAQ